LLGSAQRESYVLFVIGWIVFLRIHDGIFSFPICCEVRRHRHGMEHVVDNVWFLKIIVVWQNAECHSGSWHFSSALSSSSDV